MKQTIHIIKLINLHFRWNFKSIKFKCLHWNAELFQLFDLQNNDLVVPLHHRVHMEQLFSGNNH